MSTTDTVRCPSCSENIPTDYVVCPYDGYSLIKQLREKIRIQIKLRESISRIIRIIKNPRNNSEIVFEEVVTNYDRKGPLIILLLLGWVFGFQIAPYFNAYYLSIGNGQNLIFIYMIGFLGGLIVSIASLIFLIIFWYILSFIIHFASKMISGSIAGASFKETQSIVGYSLVPYLVGMFLLNILLFIVIPTSSSNFFKSNPNTGLVIGLSDDLASSVSIFYLIFFLGFSIWTVYLCATGLEKLHRLSRNQSYLVPIVVLVLYMFVAKIITI